jgi:hypothetical protein
VSEAAFVTCLLWTAWLAAVAGMGWLALSMPVHARQAWDGAPSPASARLLRWMGMAGIATALGLCMAVDHPSMAVLVWVMALTGAALLVAFTLAWRPRWLRMLAPWV